MAQSTRNSYGQDLRSYGSWCDDNDLAPLNAGAVAITRFLEHERSRGLASGTLSRRWGTLKRFFEYLVQAGELRQSPMDDPRMAPKPKHHRHETATFLQVDDLRALISAAQTRGPDTWAAVCLLGVHGLQPAEVCSLRVEHVQTHQGRPALVIPDRERGTWTPLISPTAEAVERLRAGRGSSEPLLTNDAGRALTNSNLRYRIRVVAESAGVDPPPSPRVLRTTAAALAMSRGVPTRQLLDLLGVEGLRHIWKFAEQVRPHYYAHAAEAVAHTVIEGGHLVQAERLLMDNDVHPAVPTMTAAAALENALREWVREAGIEMRNEQKASLATYGGRLRGAGLIREPVVQVLATITDARDHAAHGWFDKVTPGRAKRTIEAIRHILESHGRPIP